MAFPNTYTVGITSLGYQIIWSILAKRKDVDVRRLFTDQAERAHKTSDLFGISLSWELDGPVLLDLLEQQSIPIWTYQRSDNHPLVFGGGPVLTANPEPFAPFLDVVLLGDGESLLPEFIDKYQEIRSLPRKHQLEELSLIPGIYIPSLYIPNYSKDGELMSIQPINSKIPSTVCKQTWQSKTLNHSTVITPQAAWPNIHMVEVVRSCPELCRFCLASYLTLPFRSSILEDGLIPAIEKGMSATNRIGLLGASVTQHPQFADLLDWINHDRFENIHLSVSSVRASTVTPKMTKIFSKRGCKSLTIAIESGSERIRNLVNKKLSEEEIIAAVNYAKEGGLNGIKLYGIVGLPHEENEDIEKTAELLIRLKKSTQSLRICFGVSTFVPKAHTPFQWYGLNANAKKRLKLLAKALRPKGIELRPESYGWSLIQTLISRGDRRLAAVIVRVRGSENSLGNWKKIYREVQECQTLEKNNPQANMPKLPIWEDMIHKNWTHSQILPWSHLQGPVKPTILIQHQEQSLKNANFQTVQN